MGHWWQDEPWRMIQTNLRQIDMRDMDAKAYVESFREFGATVTLLNTGGIMASYDTKVEDHTRSDYLQGDSLETVMLACRDAGIRVIARMDFSKIRRPVYEKHPDWAYRTIDGQVVDYNGDVHACLCGGFQQKKAFEILEEVIDTLPIDGVFINMGGFQVRDYSYNYHGICHCDNCKKAFREMYGLALPAAEDMKDPVFRKYKLFQAKVQKQYKQHLIEMIHGKNPELAIDGVDFLRIESNTEYKRPLPYRPYASASSVRGIRGIGEGDRRCSNPSVDFIGFFYRHVAVSAPLQAMRGWQNIANFGLMDYYIIGRLYDHEDKSSFEEVKRVFHYHAEHDADLRNIKSCAKTLLIRSGGYALGGGSAGWVRLLTENHILFDEAEPGAIRADSDLSGYDAVILTDVPTLGTDVAEMLDRYVESGGTLIADGQTGRYDENADERTACAFRSMGVSRITCLRDDMVSAMLHVEEKDLADFPSFADTKLIYFGDDFLFCEYEPGVKKYFHLIPPHQYGPPERCYYTQVTDLPGLTANAYGRGKAILIPWNPGVLYDRDGYDNTMKFVRDLLVHVAGLSSCEDAPFTPMVEVTMGIEKSGAHALINLVNGTGHFGTSFFPPVPVGDIALKLPLEKKPSALVSQTTGKPYDFTWEKGVLRFTAEVPGYFESVKVTF